MRPKISSLFEEPPEAPSTAVTPRMAENSQLLGAGENAPFQSYQVDFAFTWDPKIPERIPFPPGRTETWVRHGSGIFGNFNILAAAASAGSARIKPEYLSLGVIFLSPGCRRPSI